MTKPTDEQIDTAIEVFKKRWDGYGTARGIILAALENYKETPAGNTSGEHPNRAGY